MTEYDITKAFKRIEDELIESMIRNMDRHRAGEALEGFNWSMWQVEQLQSLEKFKRENLKTYGKEFASINDQIKALLQRSRDAGGMEQETSILNAIKKGYRPPKGSRMTGQFFRLNDRKLKTLIQATTKDMQKAETAVLRMANDQYRKAIFNAQVYANSGAGTYEQAVDMATKDMLTAGLNCIEYKNGARHTLSDYADMAIRTANKRAYLQGEGGKRQEWGISTVIINKRGNPCPRCLPYVGKVLIDDVWSGGSRKDGDYPLMSAAVAAGLYHPRCQDSHTTYFPGISTADGTWTRAELEKIEAESKKKARLQYAGRQTAKYDRISKNSLDNENKKKYEKLAEEWSGDTKDGIMDKRYKARITEGLPDIKTLENDAGRERFATELVSKLDIDAGDVKIGLQHTNSRGHCTFTYDGDNCNYHTYVLQADDDRSVEYRAKTAFHEAYHLSLKGGKWDALITGGINPKWLDVEETFAETSAHYAVKMLGSNKVLAPSYPEKLIRTLPRLKKLDEFKDCSSLVDFGRIAWDERMSKKTGIWSGLHDKIFAPDFDEIGYYRGYFDTIRKNEAGLFDKMLENSPSLKSCVPDMKRELKRAMDHCEGGGDFMGMNNNQKMVLSNMLINAMIKEGIR